ncbi:PAS fold family [Gloeomargarita lithophora Alchichica-D10]|uniref:PAS fold family n=1 Tax=Gloeomargarita lithophora Alchichica-D10 TaxID=1188229 RepID=A0A1J0A8U3_9CYAN|nr:EAL domain-containing protein [Gloeomargarita lithophora]APB32360.1 PAS fold family [Gloeomargarita lithophora Alchichica-D10]
MAGLGFILLLFFGLLGFSRWWHLRDKYGFFNQLEVGLALVNHQGRIGWANDYFCTLSGYDRLALSGMKPKEEWPLRTVPWGSYRACVWAGGDGYRSFFENAIEGIFQTTVDGRYLRVNPALARIYGYHSPAELVVNLTNIAQQLYVDSQRRAEFVRLLQQQDQVCDFEAEIYRKDGSRIWIAENARAVRDGQGRLLYYEGTVEDITRRKQAEDQLLRHAFYDPLTGLANRALCLERLREWLAQERYFTLLFLDLDRFKLVNDTLGHTVGDELLVQVGQRLQAWLTPADLVARWAGDEFVILLGTGVPAAQQWAEQVLSYLTQPLTIREQEVVVAASIGMVASQGYTQPETLLRDADTAMYQAKLRGKAQWALFDTQMRAQIAGRLQLELDLRRVIERQELVLHYQPIVALATERVVGWEALVRWQHPQRGLISPGEFIPLAEEIGFTLVLGQWVLQTATGQLRHWQQQGLCDDQVYMSVNLSGRQVAHSRLVAWVQTALQESGLLPRCLRLEVTENSISEGVERVVSHLTTLGALGVGLSIDDFGTGYSSLSRLHQFPMDMLKIDRSFICSLGQPGPATNLVQGIVTLAASLEMQVVAEGIETPAQLWELKNMGVTYGQGFLLAKPCPDPWLSVA